MRTTKKWFAFNLPKMWRCYYLSHYNLTPICQQPKGCCCCFFFFFPKTTWYKRPHHHFFGVWRVCRRLWATKQICPHPSAPWALLYTTALTIASSDANKTCFTLRGWFSLNHVKSADYKSLVVTATTFYKIFFTAIFVRHSCWVLNENQSGWSYP